MAYGGVSWGGTYKEDEQPTVEMAEDCISRQATIDAIYKKHIGGKDAIENAPINDLYACGLEEAVDAVEDMPSVTPQPKRGQWIDTGMWLEGRKYGKEQTRSS